MKKAAIIIFIISLGVLLALSVVYLINRGSQPEGQVSLDNIEPDYSSSTADGNLHIVDIETDQIVTIKPERPQDVQFYTNEKLGEILHAIWSPDSRRAIVITENDSKKEIRYIIDTSNKNYLVQIDESWQNLTWLDARTIAYSVINPGSGDEVTGVFAFNAETRSSVKLFDFAGSSEDRYAKLGNYFIHVSASTDASPVSVKIYNLEDKKVVKQTSVEMMTFMSASSNRIVLAGSKLLVISLDKSNQPVVAQTSAYKVNALYYLSGQALYGLVQSDNGSLMLGTLLFNDLGKWLTQDISGYDAKAVGYLQSFSVRDNKIFLVGRNAVINYNIK